ncbi:pre-mRNA-splicing ATP-dependent RNA helicase PRP28 [Myriangium duriaei CBS 260.36]|uniref:RNA helicase n=1 Tax=Myriangium duriaei CBS 260.36 TaxID=1168546 RepID=A0A9P4ML09_9PEZI|nr:pre-mRNA-splicing ATP-dependent RNA helicase PRP28 [Myriangium duriaei CBS 260.36]
MTAPPPPPPGGAGAAPVPRKSTPLNIEDVLARKKAADAEAAKPRFISRKERERIASATEAAAKPQAPVARPKFSRPSVVTNGIGTNGAATDIPTGPRAQQIGQGKSFHKDAGGTKRPPPPPPPPSEDMEKAQIRQRYMGSEAATSKFSASKKRKRTTEKKFNFEWDLEEDTTKNTDALYQTRQEANFFGRGRLGGFADTGDMTKALDYAKMIEERDPETGKARAQQFLELEKARYERNSRLGIDKHWSEKKLENMRERDWRIFKEDFQISSRGGSIPNPMRSWSESGLPRRLLDIVDQVGYKDPSPVQRAAIPIALQSRDLIGVAVTGSGKTAAFLLPLLVYISELPPLNEATKMDGPYAIILAPTRELAQQIELEAKKFATPLGFTCVSLVGGHSIEEQAYNMRDGAEIIIATPGRLVDCIERRVLVLSQCCYIIMDEADRMIDMGFEEPVNCILSALPVSNEKPDTDAAEDSNAMSRLLGGKDRYRQTMMYTATMPTAVERIARNYLRRPAIVTIGNTGEAVDTVEQRVEFIQGEEKRKKRMAEILTSRQFAPPVIVFVNIKRNCDAVARDIQRMGFSAVTLHGSKTQEQREAALQGLKDHKYEVLVATDLAGRGIDVQDVSLVINFNMAPSIEAYTHRIGRTGRAGKSGVAITFLGNEDSDVLFDLKKMIQNSSVSRLPDELRKHEAAQQPRSKGNKKVEDSGAFGGKGGWN